MDSSIRLEFEKLPLNIVRTIETSLTLPNPRHEQIKKYSRWKGYNTAEEFLTFYDVANGFIIIPRGFINQLIAILKGAGITYEIDDRTRKEKELNIEFRGTLEPFQQQSLGAVLARRQGVLEAPTGSGKTVIALAAIAARKQSALVIVHTKELMYQWRERALEFLSLDENDIGLVGDGKKQTGKSLTIAIVNSLVPLAQTMKNLSGHVIVDECHHVPARTFTDAVSIFDARFILGLSATPYRSDGLTNVINLYLGDTVFRINTQELQDCGKISKAKLIARQTPFNYYNPAKYYSKMLKALAANKTRNDIIISDIINHAKKHTGICLALSDRVEHIKLIAAGVEGAGLRAGILTGDMPAQERASVVRELLDGKIKVLAATSQLIGEGFDLKALSCIFMCTPIRFSGKVKQCIGRILRVDENKAEAVIYDYEDACGVLKASFRARCLVYQELGVCIPQEALKGYFQKK